MSYEEYRQGLNTIGNFFILYQADVERKAAEGDGVCVALMEVGTAGVMIANRQMQGDDSLHLQLIQEKLASGLLALIRLYDEK